jgi:hypothetical protein
VIDVSQASEVCAQGLKQFDVPPADVLAGVMPWPQVLYLRLKREFGLLTFRRAVTEEAEIGLRIDPASYWYVGRVEPDYSPIATLSTAPPAGRAGVSRVCPFDSGGLWHGKIKTGSNRSEVQRRELFQQSIHEVEQYHDPMMAWLDAAYPMGKDAYSRDGVPTYHTVPEIVIEANPRSWTWEMSVTSTADAGLFPTPVAVYITPSSLSFYRDWLMNTPSISTGEMAAHLDLFKDLLRVSAEPYQEATNELIASTT